MTVRIRRRWALWSVLSIIAAAEVEAGNWPGWRGDGSGAARHQDVPAVWAAGRNIRWDRRIEGYGISSPIVWGDRVFVTTATTGLQGLWSSRLAVWLGLAAAVGSLAAGWLARRHTEHRLLDRMDRFLLTALALAFAAGLIRLFVVVDDIDRQGGVFGWRWSMALLCIAVGMMTALQARCTVWKAGGALALLFAVAMGLRLGPARSISRTEVAAAAGFGVMAMWWLGSTARHWRQRHAGSRPTAARAVAAALILAAGGWQYCAANVLHSRDEYRRIVLCLNVDDGHVLWRRIVFETPRVPTHHQNSYATPTPACDGTYLAADFGVGLSVLDMNGRVLWKVRRPEYSRYLIFGGAPSPLLFRDLVIAVYYPEALSPEKIRDSATVARLTAYDRRTGEVRWEQGVPGGHDCYGSPVLCEYAGEAAVAVATWGYLLVCSAVDGRRLLVRELATSECTLTGLWDGSVLYLPVGTQHRTEGLQALPMVGENGRGPILWRNRLRGNVIASPALYEGLLYMISDRGIAVCLRPATGEELWRLELEGERYYASVVCGDGKVYFSSTDGTTTVVQAGGDGGVLHQNDIGARILATPAIANHALFLRAGRRLYCVRESADR